MTSQQAFHNSFKMDTKQKFKITSKISKMDKQFHYLQTQMNCSEAVKEVLCEKFRKKKRSMHKRLNAGMVRKFEKKKVNSAKIHIFKNYLKSLKSDIYCSMCSNS